MALALLGGCTDPAPDGAIRLEVVAVKADPPSGVPGTTVRLELIHSAMLFPRLLRDGSSGSEAPSQSNRSAAIDPSSVRTAWFGGCHNPPSGQYYGCLPMLQAVAAQLPDPVPETLPTGTATAGLFGLGTTFALPIPDDVLVDSRSGPQGVSYAFFAACRGNLRPKPELYDTVPLGCYGDDGTELGTEDFATGFTTIHTAPGLVNTNPQVIGASLDGVWLERASCASDADCKPLGGGELDYRCGGDAECWPVIADCTRSRAACADLNLRLVVTSESAQTLAQGGASRPRETLYAEVWSVLARENGSEELYPGYGAFETDTDFRLSPLPRGALADQESLPLLAVVRDGRGGTDWLWWSFLREQLE